MREIHTIISTRKKGGVDMIGYASDVGGLSTMYDAMCLSSGLTFGYLMVKSLWLIIFKKLP